MYLNLGMQTAPLQSVDLIRYLKVSMCANFYRVTTQFCVAPVHERPTSLTLQAKILLSLRAARCIAHRCESWCVRTPAQPLRRLLMWAAQTLGVGEWKRFSTNQCSLNICLFKMVSLKRHTLCQLKWSHIHLILVITPNCWSVLKEVRNLVIAQV